MIIIDLEDKNNAQVLINLLDIALKAKGIEAAESVLYFNRKITKAIEELEAEELKSGVNAEEEAVN